MTSLSRLSKLLALFLRHRPEEAGLQIDNCGFVPVAEVLKALQARYPEVGEADIRRLVDGSSPPRFEIGERGIRALYGHSFFVEMDGEPAQVPESLYMGCLRKEVQRYRAEGIKPVDRYYVHLSLTKESAAERSHQPGDPCVIEILAAQAQVAGHKFYRRGEVVLTLEIPAQFVGQVHGLESMAGPRPRSPESEPRSEARPERRPAHSPDAPAPAFGRRPRKATGRR